MAGEKKIENPVMAAPGLKSDPCIELAEQNGIAGNGVQYNSTSSLPSSEDATSNIKGGTGMQSVAEQGFYNPTTTSCCDYYYPGYNETFSQSDDRGYFNAGAGSFAGSQSDNGSFLYYLPSYSPYSAGTFMGIDGQQQYFSSSEYRKHHVSYESEAMACYSWDSQYAGDVTIGTSAMPGKSKSASNTNISVKSNNSDSMKTSSSHTSKFSMFPLDSKPQQSMSSSNFYSSVPRTQPSKLFNKLGSSFQSAGLAKDYHPVDKFSSFANRNQGLFTQYSQVNHRSNGRIWSGNNRFKLVEKSNRNGDLEASAELTRGPRTCSGSNHSNSSVNDAGQGINVQKYQVNREDFCTEYDNAKFYVIKSYSEDDIHKCIKYDVWSSTPSGNKKLDAAFHDVETKAKETGQKCPVFLFFSVNGSGQFIGLAEMIGKVDFNKTMDFWQLDKWSGFFPVKWHIIKDIPNAQLRHIMLVDGENRDVTFTRDTQEIGLGPGTEMLKVFKSHSGKTSLLDDFNFYENREKLLRAKRSSKPASSQTDGYKTNSIHNHLRAGGNFAEDSVRTNISDPTSSVIALTENLSLSN